MAAEITDRHPSTRTMMNHFDFEHLPALANPLEK